MSVDFRKFFNLKKGYTKDELVSSYNNKVTEINRMNSLVGNKSRTTDKKISGRGSLVSKYQALRFAVLMNDFRDVEINLD